MRAIPRNRGPSDRRHNATVARRPRFGVSVLMTYSSTNRAFDIRIAILALLGGALLAVANAVESGSRVLLQLSPVMGFRHYEGKALWGQLQVGDSVQLLREPDNSHDAHAIRVECRGHKLGY